ncbi:MAG: GNAT family N-acetyltransferase [Clostridiales bacterium]|nr:GNAT family N-acetyltransferase [Clostridiales bacterium]
MEITIRHAASKDITKLLEIQKIAFTVQAKLYDAYDIPPMIETAEQIDLNSTGLIVLVAVIDGEIAGSIRVVVGSNDAEIKRLSVAEKFQKKGIGTKLLKEAEMYCENLTRIWLFTGGQSKSNIELYKKLGFIPFKEEHWKDNFTLIYMEKYL